MVFHGTRLVFHRAERQRREARHETYITPKLVTTRRSILGPPAEGRPGPSVDDDDDDDDDDIDYVVDVDDDDDDVVLKQEYLPPRHLQQQPQLQRWPLGRR